MLISFLIYLILTYFYFKTRKFFVFSPVDIFILFFSSVLIFTILYHNFIPDTLKFNFYHFDEIKTKNYNKTIIVFLNMIVFFVLGSFAYSIKDLKHQEILKSKISFLDIRSVKFDAKFVSFLLFWLFIISLILVFIDYGFGLFQRGDYIPKKNSNYKTIYQLIFIFISLLSGVLYKKQKFFSSIIIISITFISIGIGSRYATINLLLFGTIISLFISPKRRTYFYIFFIPFLILFFGYNISLRSESNGHGLIPYLKITFQQPEIIFKYALENIYYTFIFGFYATGETLQHYKNPNFHKLYTCLSPLPGFLTDWYMYAKNMRLNLYAPFTSIGEISSYSYFSYIYYFILGFYFTFIDKFIKTQFILKKYIFAISIFLTLIIFIVLSFEYNLRSSNRYLYYSFFIYFVGISLNKKIISNAKKQ